MKTHLLGAACAALALAAFAGGAEAAPDYHPITPSMASKTVVLTGHDLTIEQVVEVARYGAKVALSPEARQRSSDTYDLMNEGAAEGLSVYLFNRGAGAQRETVTFTGDPMSPENRPVLEARALAGFRNGARSGYGPEFSDEETVRAIMLVRANQMTYLPASPGLMQASIDLLNNDITPVMRTRAGTGEAQGPAAGPINAAMVGAGEVYYHGQRMPAADALAKAGLKPIQPGPGDGTLGTVNADVAGPSALLVANAKDFLDWADMAYAMDLDGMNSSVTPLMQPVQVSRPYKWINWEAGRVLDMLKGGYLFDDPSASAASPAPPRAFPANLTLSPTRQGAAWRAWGALRDATLIALNSSDQSPAFRVGISSRESPELSTPQMVKYFVRGGKANGGKRGYIVPTLNRDPYPMANEVAFFTAALGMLDQAICQRTGAPLPGALPPPDDGMIAIGHGRQVIDATFGLLAIDIVNAAKLMDDRAAEDSARLFGLPPAAARTAFRSAVPPQTAGDAALAAAWQFLQGTQPATFYPKANPPPGTDDPIPLAQEKLKP
jgi:histidine ammonia-lyase